MKVSMTGGGMGMRTILAATMSMAQQVNFNIANKPTAEDGISLWSPWSPLPYRNRDNTNFARTFTGKRQRIKAKKRDLRHHGKLVRMKHKRA
jgi:hypothetical protein